MPASPLDGSPGHLGTRDGKRLPAGFPVRSSMERAMFEALLAASWVWVAISVALIVAAVALAVWMY